MDLRHFGLSDDELRELGYDVKGRRTGEDAGGLDHGDAGLGPSTPARRRWTPGSRTWLATVATLALVGWASTSVRWLPSPVPGSAPDGEFSSGRAMERMGDVAQQARPTGSDENERVRRYLVGYLTSLGLEPELQVTTMFSRDSATVTAATIRNVLARLAGTSSTGAIVLTAHYDGTPHSPAAGDNGVGVATLLETVRALLAGPPLRNDVIVLLTDGDELGRLGSRAFVERHSWSSDVTTVLSLEGRGARGAAFAFETGPGNRSIIESLAGSERRTAAFSFARSLGRDALDSGDEDPFRQGDKRVFSLALLQGAAWQHQPRDTQERISERAVQHSGRQLLAMTRALGGLDLRAMSVEEDHVYASLPGVGLVHYPRAGVLMTTAGLVALWGLVGLLLRGRRATRRGVAVAAIAGAGVVGASTVVAGWLRDLTSDMHPEYGSLTTAFYEDGTYVLATAALAVACGSVIYAIARRWARPDELVFGGLLAPLGYCLWLTIVDPFAAPAIQLPLALALAAGAIVVLLGPRRARTMWAWAVLIVLAAVGLVLVVPTAEALSAVWTFRSARAIGAVMGLAVVLQWPLMDRLLMPKTWWTPLTAIGLAGALVASTLPSTRSADRHPLPTTLIYLADDSFPASPALPAGSAAVPGIARARSVAGKWLTVAGPGQEWARSWAGEIPTGPTDAGVLMLGADSLYEIVGTAPVADLVPPSVSASTTVERNGRSLVELALRPGLPGEMTGVHLPPGTGARLVGVEQAEWGLEEPPVRSVAHWGDPVAPELRVYVELERGMTEFDIVVLEHNMLPRDVLGTDFFERSEELIANVHLGSDRAIQRTTLRVSVQ